MRARNPTVLHAPTLVPIRRSTRKKLLCRIREQKQKRKRLQHAVERSARSGTLARLIPTASSDAATAKNARKFVAASSISAEIRAAWEKSDNPDRSTRAAVDLSRYRASRILSSQVKPSTSTSTRSRQDESGHGSKRSPFQEIPTSSSGSHPTDPNVGISLGMLSFRPATTVEA